MRLCSAGSLRPVLIGEDELVLNLRLGDAQHLARLRGWGRAPGDRPHPRAWFGRLGRAGARPRERGVGQGAGRQPRSHQPLVAPGSPGDGVKVSGGPPLQPVTATAAMRAARARCIDLGPTRVSSAPTTASNPPGPLPDRTTRARWTAPRRRHSRAREGARSWQATRVTACRNHFPCLKPFVPLNARRSRQSGRARGEGPRDGGATRTACRPRHRAPPRLQKGST